MTSNTKCELVDYGNTNKPSMHGRLGSLLQLAFPRESDPTFPVGDIPEGQQSCKVR